MSDALRSRAEVMKLATLLHREPSELEYLELLAPEDLRLLREQVMDMLFTAHDATMQRLAAASKLLPVGLVATLGQHAFGPTLSARICALLDPARALEVAAKLPYSFLADVAVEIDPRRTSDVIAGIPVDRVAEITTELTRRGEYVTMGRFVGHLGDDALAAAVATIDDATLLRTAFVLEQRDRLDALAELVGEERLVALIDTAEREDLWPEVIDLLSRLDQERLAEGLARMDAERRGLVAARARESGLVDWPAPTG
jgi:hypothetical protein